MVQEADRDCRPQLLVVVAFAKLLLKRAGRVVDDPTGERRLAENPHFNIEQPATLIACPHIDNRQLVVVRRLRVERIEDLDILDPCTLWPLQNAVEHIDQQRLCPLLAREQLESVINLRVDAENHGGHHSEKKAATTAGDDCRNHEGFQRCFFRAARALSSSVSPCVAAAANASPSLASRQGASIVVGRRDLMQMPDEEILQPPPAIGSAVGVAHAWDHQELKLFAGLDQRVAEPQRTFRWHVSVQLAVDQQQFPFQLRCVLDVR